MVEVEIKIKREDIDGNYFIIVPIGEYSDKIEVCYVSNLTDEEVLLIAKPVINEGLLYL